MRFTNLIPLISSVFNYQIWKGKKKNIMAHSYIHPVSVTDVLHKTKDNKRLNPIVHSSMTKVVKHHEIQVR